MRLVIDKDYPEIQILQESYEKNKPIYKVLAVENGEKFVYGKGLTFNEARNTLFDLAVDENFDVQQVEISECVGESEKTIWSSDEKTLVQESTMVKEGFGDWLSGVWKSVKDTVAKFNKNVVNWWRKNKYIDKQNRLTGIGYKVMTQEIEPPKEGDDGKDQKEDQERQKNLEALWKTIQTNAKQAVDAKKEYEPVNLDEVKGIVKKDNEPVLLQVPVVTKAEDGGKPEELFLLLTQDGEATKSDEKGNPLKGDDGQPVAPDANAGTGSANGGNNDGGNNGGAANTQQISPDQAQKNPKAAIGNLAQRVTNLEEEVGIANESTSYNWNYDNQVNTNRQGLERLVIKRFFNDLNDPSIKEIKFVSESGNVKVYETAKGSEAYSEFKKDFRETTANATGKFAEYRITVESGFKSKLNGYKFSSFGLDDDFDSEDKVVVFKESTKKIVSPDDGDSKKKVEPTIVNESEVKLPEVPNDTETCGLTLELDKKDPLEQVQALLASMNKYNGIEKKTPENYDGTIDTGVSTYPDVPTFETPKKQEPLEVPEQKTPKVETPEVVKEAEGDDDAGDDDDGGDADPFGGGDDAGGGDEGGGDADPFGGGDEGGDAEGGDAGGDAGGDVDPFGGGAAGGDAGGGAPGGGDMGGGDAGGAAGGEGTEGGDEASGEPAAEPAVNTDAQGNPQSQYNINVTEPFNAEQEFTLNEEEQKEFFGKIDQLVKIPDMDNYSLYLYQITPENMNLDDVHYIEALYQLSVKLGLLEDVYADSNLLEKYNSYKYSVVKNGEGEDATKGDDALTVQEQNNPIWQGNRVLSEAKESEKKTGVSKVQDDNEKKNEESKKDGTSEKDDERRGAKDMKLDLDKNGAPKPVIIDTTKEGWDSLNGKEHGKLVDSTVEGDFHGLGWLATFKAMQFGSPRYMTMYIKRNGNEKAEKQCEEYLKRLSYTEIEFVKIEEIDPYEYIYRQSCSGMKTPEEIQQASVVNKDIPYLESSEPDSVPNDIKRDIKKVITKLNAEIRNTKQFNFMNETGVFKPQIDPHEFMMGYRTAKVDETVSETTYKFVFKKNDSTFSRMFYSNLKEKLFKYLGLFAQKFGLECGCESTPKAIVIDFIRSNLGNPGYDLDTMVDTVEEQPVETDNTEDAL